MKIWRIASEKRAYSATDLSGAGSALSPGRWNAEKEAVVYCGTSIALCVLETAAYIDSAGLPLNRFLVEIEVPAPVWAARKEMLDPTKLPGGWDAIPAGKSSVELGSSWLTSTSSAILLVPSVIVPEEAVALVNPKHVDAAKITARVVRRFEYNKLLRKS